MNIWNVKREALKSSLQIDDEVSLIGRKPKDIVLSGLLSTRMKERKRKKHFSDCKRKTKRVGRCAVNDHDVRTRSGKVL